MTVLMDFVYILPKKLHFYVLPLPPSLRAVLKFGRTSSSSTAETSYGPLIHYWKAWPHRHIYTLFLQSLQTWILWGSLVSEFVQFVLLWHNFEGCTLQFGSVGGPWLFGEGVAILSCLSSQHSFSDQNIYLSYGYGNCPAKNMILSWRNTLDEIALPLPKHS